jgi:hypothetical protein
MPLSVVSSTESMDDSLDLFFQSAGFPVQDSTCTFNKRNEARVKEQSLKSGKRDTCTSKLKQAKNLTSLTSTSAYSSGEGTWTDLLAVSSSPASSPLWFFSSDEEEHDNEVGVEATATATLTLQQDGSKYEYTILPFRTILTSHPYTCSSTSKAPAAAATAPAEVGHLFPSLGSTCSNFDEHAFPQFPTVLPSVSHTSAAHVHSLLSEPSQYSSSRGSSHKSQLSSGSPSHPCSSLGDGIERVIKTISGKAKQDTLHQAALDPIKTTEEIEQQLEDYQEIDCTLSCSTSISTMTKENNTLTPDGRADPTTSTTNKSRKRQKSPSQSTTHGIQKAFSKLALCGQSAKEEAFNLEYLVMTLRQALTAEEATTALRDMVQVLKDGRNGTAQQKKTAFSTSQLQEGLVAAGADHCVISTQWNFPSDILVQYYGTVALGELVAHSHLPNQKSIVLKGGIEVVLTAMKSHSDHESIQEEACRTLKNLMKYYDQAKLQVARHKGITRILQAMMTHPEYATVQRQACYALTSLSCLKSISDELVCKQGHAVLLKTVQHHSDDPYVLAEAWRTLTNIVIHSMNHTLDEEIAAHGMSLVFEALYKFADCRLVPIQIRGLTLLTHLSYRSPGNLAIVTQLEHLEIIHRVLDLWTEDEKLQAAGNKLIQHIGQNGSRRSALKVNSHQEDSNPSLSAGRSGKSHSTDTTATNSLGSRKSRRGVPPKSAVISLMRNDRGLDVIVDSSLY